MKKEIRWNSWIAQVDIDTKSAMKSRPINFMIRNSIKGELSSGPVAFLLLTKAEARFIADRLYSIAKE